ncbi:MAG: hypothetical protein QF464_09760 [Myxococcota bacterium]|nr:hypothetical protein [Myxococcota bacterium]
MTTHHLREARAAAAWTWLAVIFLAGCGAAEPAPPPPPTLEQSLGMAVPHLMAARPVDVEMRVEAGVRWVRRDIAWARVEQEVGVFDFTEADAVIDAEVAAGVQVLVLLDYGHPAYAAESNGDVMVPPDDLADFGRYAETVAEHFRGRVSAYELWNEPNFSIFWKPAPSPEGYAALAAVAAESVRLTDPDATILLGGTLGNWDPLSYDGRPWGFLEEVLVAQPDLLERVDVLAFHPYTWLQQELPETPSGSVDPLQVSFVDMITDLRRITAAHGRPEIPLWSTEQGFHTATKLIFSRGVSEELQGHLLVRTTLLALAQGVDKVFHFTYQDGLGDLYDKESHFGVVRHPSLSPDGEAPEPKPAYWSHQVLASKLEDTVAVHDLREDLDLASDVFAFRLQSTDGDDTVVAWTTSGSATPLTLDGAPRDLTDAPLYVPISPP